MDFPEPVISIAIEPKTKADQEKLGKRFSAWRWKIRPSALRSTKDTGQTLISGIGQLHLEIIVDRMRREFKVGATLASRRWLIKRRSQRRPERKANSLVSFGEGPVWPLRNRLEPGERGSGFTFKNQVRAGPFQKSLFRLLKKACRNPCWAELSRISGRRHQGDASGRILPRRRLN